MALQHTNLNANQSIIDDITRFKGEYNDIYRDPFVGGSAYIFVTRPLLFLEPSKPVISNYNGQLAYENMTRDPFFIQFLTDEVINELDNKLIYSMIYNQKTIRSNFLPIFTNQTKTFSPSSTNLEMVDYFTTQNGYKQILPTNKITSESSGQIQITVQEDTNLTFTKMAGIWVNYISNITDGTFNANPEMVHNGILDYTSSIYYFVLEPDGKTLKFWSKYTGCWPLSIPYEELSYSRGEHSVNDLTITFSYNTREDMNPAILEDFNITSLNLGLTRIEREIRNSYTSFRESPLLNRTNLEKIIANGKDILESEERDPLIIYRPESDSNDPKTSIKADSRAGGYELIFDDYAYDQHILENIIDDDISNYFTDYSTGNTLRKRGE